MARMPRNPPPAGSSRSYCIDFYTSSRGQQDDLKASGEWHPGEWLMGHILPPFQRPLVWDEMRMVRFVESAWDGLDLGRLVINDAMDAPHDQPRPGSRRWHPTDRWIIDGQQRLTALDRYLSDAFPVRGLLWSEVETRDRRFFLMQPMGTTVTGIFDEAELRSLYDRLNYGGVPHAPEHRAVPEDGGARPRFR